MNKKLLLISAFLLNLQVLNAQELSQKENTNDFYNALINTQILSPDRKKSFKINDSNNSVKVIVFLAGWCPPCGLQIIELNKLQNKFQRNNIQIIGLNIDNNSTRELITFIKTFKPHFRIGLADEKVGELLFKFSSASAIPQTLIISDNQIQQIFIGSDSKSTDKIEKSIREIISHQK